MARWYTSMARGLDTSMARFHTSMDRLYISMTSLPPWLDCIPQWLDCIPHWLDWRHIFHMKYMTSMDCIYPISRLYTFNS